MGSRDGPRMVAGHMEGLGSLGEVAGLTEGEDSRLGGAVVIAEGIKGKQTGGVMEEVGLVELTSTRELGTVSSRARKPEGKPTLLSLLEPSNNRSNSPCLM